MPFAPLGGHSVYYTEHVRGPAERPPLMLVHGSGGTLLHWPPELRRLDNAAVYALDLPGHGQSGGAANISVIEKAEAVLAVLADARRERAVIGGHSLGSAIALTLALMRPDRVAGLVLVGAGAKLRVTPEILDHALTDFPQAVNSVIEYAFGSAAPGRLVKLARERMLETAPQVLLGDLAACDAFDVRERLGEIHVPTLILCGDEDRLTPPKYAQFLAERIPGAELKLFPRAGHMVMLEQPEAVTAAVAEFMQAAEGGRQ
jgi:pimeloyl-ACP methyl ester carboxylesterase